MREEIRKELKEESEAVAAAKEREALAEKLLEVYNRKKKQKVKENPLV